MIEHKSRMTNNGTTYGTSYHQITSGKIIIDIIIAIVIIFCQFYFVLRKTYIVKICT